MSKILVVKSLPEDTTGLLFLDRSDSRASVVELGEGVSLENGVLSASGGGGGGGSVEDLTDFEAGLIGSPVSTGDIIYNVGFGEQHPTTQWTNIPLSLLMSGATTSYLGALPGRAPGKILAVNATDDGFEWISP